MGLPLKRQLASKKLPPNPPRANGVFLRHNGDATFTLAGGAPVALEHDRNSMEAYTDAKAPRVDSDPLTLTKAPTGIAGGDKK